MTKHFYRAFIFAAIAVSFMSVASQPKVFALEPKADNRFEANPRSPIQDWSFSFKNYPMNHQWTANKLNIAVHYTLKLNASSHDAPDFTKIFNQIDHFLVKQPQDDYWEIVNRKLTDVILQENAALDSVTIRLEVQPRPNVPFICTTTVTRTKSGQLLELWSFSTMNLPVNQQGRQTVNVYADYTYKIGIRDSEYPDFMPIQKQIADFLKHYLDQPTSWEMVNRKLAGAILSNHSAIASVTLRLETLPTQDLPYTYSSAVTLAR